MRSLFHVLLLVIALPATASSARFNLQPGSTVLAGTPVELRLEGLPPGGEIELVAERHVYSSVLGNQLLKFRSSATFAVAADGTLDLASAAPLSGSYEGADLRGLFWSMQPTTDAVAPKAETGRVWLRASAAGTELARTDLRFIQVDPNVVVRPAAGFPGAVFASLPVTGKQRRPALILLGGGEGGAKAARDEAPKLASHGFAVLGLPYYSPPAMPGGPREFPELPGDFADIPVERLNAVRDWLRRQPGVDGARIGLYGASKGAEYALLAAAEFDWVKAVVAIAPSDVVWEGYGYGLQEPGQRSSFALHGKPLPFVPMQGFVEEYLAYLGGADLVLRRPHDRGRAAHPARAVAARIPVEKYQGPLLVLAGQDDQLWNAAMMAHNIAERRAAAGLGTTTLIYSEAGHYLNGNGWAPTTHYGLAREKSGGTPAGNARAQADAWPRVLAFLHASLQR